MATATKPRPRREVKNTYRLPEGRALRMALRDWFREQRGALIDYLRTGRIERKDDTLGDVAGYFDFPDWDEFGLDAAVLVDRIIDSVWSTFLDYGSRFRSWLGVGVRREVVPGPDTWTADDPELKPVVEKIARDMAESVNETSANMVRRVAAKVAKEVADGTISPGEAESRLAAEVKAAFDESEAWRARRIAITEASRIAHEAQYRAGEESGMVTGWRWLASADACSVCLTIARRCPVVKAGQPFAVIGDHADYSTILHPPAHPHCRCSMTEVLDTDEQPEWGTTLIDPEPEQEDIDAAEEYAAANPKPGKAPKSKSKPRRAAHLLAAEKEAGVKFTPPENTDPDEYVTVVVDVSKVDAAMAGRENYVGPGGTGAAIGGRYENFRDFLGRAREGGTAIEQPRAYISLEDDAIDLGDGRHRWAVFRDEGQSLMPVTVPRDQADEIRRRYGARR